MTSFLDLPLLVRYRVYAYFDHLARPCPIELNRPYESPLPSSAYPSSFRRYFRAGCLYTHRNLGVALLLGRNEPDCVCPKLPLHLLLVSRVVYQDVFYLFYSRNKFVIRLHNGHGFESLHLNLHILSTITFLLVRLNSWRCPRGHEKILHDSLLCWACDTPKAEADLPLDIATRGGQSLLSRWRSFVECLALSPSLSQLELTIICDVVDKISAIAVLEPLLQLPTVKRCAIRLRPQFDYEFYKLARDASHRAQGSYSETLKIFPFQRFPKELRLKILGYTHLGINNSYGQVDRLLRIERNRLVQGNFNFLHPLADCCRNCTGTLVDCCCAPVRAAYSSNCDCRLVPLGLLCVSKEMRAEAIEVLLSQNCFDFRQDPEMTIGFLTNFPQGALKLQRRIEFQIMEEEIKKWDQLAYREKLIALFIFIKDNFHLERLYITVIVDSYELGRAAEEEEDNRYIYDVYRDITRALSPLPVLENLELVLGWFDDLAPVMKRAILGQQHPKCASKRPLSVSSEWSAETGSEVPTWYQESDFTRYG